MKKWRKNKKNLDPPPSLKSLKIYTIYFKLTGKKNVKSIFFSYLPN